MHDLTQNQTTEKINAQQGYKAILEVELFAVERQSQQQTGWFMAACVILIYAIMLLDADTLQPDYRQFIDIMASVMMVWFVSNALLIRHGYYHRVIKYINITFQVSMVSFFIVFSAHIMSPQFVLSSAAPLYYVVVIGISSLTMNPFLCLLVGAIAAAQFLGIYGFWFHDSLLGESVLQGLTEAQAKEQQLLFGWTSMNIVAVIYIISGVAAMLMARKARSLLETVVVQVRYEETLNFLERDIRQAAEIQQQLIPTQDPNFPRLDIVSWYQPSKEVSGDYFDFIERPDGNKLVLIADVAGKGFSAAMMMSNIQAMVQVLAQQDISIEKLANMVNQSILKNSARGRFVSMVYFEFYPDKAYFKYLNCGHNPPLLIHENGAIEILAANAPVLGVTAESACVAHTLEYDNNDVIFAYTDGLSELRNEKRELFGESKIENLLSSLVGVEIDTIKERVLSEANQFLGAATPTDDLSFVVIKRMAPS